MAAARTAKNPGVGRGNWRAADLPDNLVTSTVMQLGGVAEAARLTKATVTTVYSWCRKGIVHVASGALRLAEAAEPKSIGRQLALARKLAGLDD